MITAELLMKFSDRVEEIQNAKLKQLVHGMNEKDSEAFKNICTDVMNVTMNMIIVKCMKENLSVEDTTSKFLNYMSYVFPETVKIEKLARNGLL